MSMKREMHILRVKETGITASITSNIWKTCVYEKEKCLFDILFRSGHMDYNNLFDSSAIQVEKIIKNKHKDNHKQLNRNQKNMFCFWAWSFEK